MKEPISPTKHSVYKRIRTMSTMSEDTKSLVSHASVRIDSVPLNQANVPEEPNEDIEQKEKEEHKSSGSVKFKVYLDYFCSGGNWFSVIFLFLSNIACAVRVFP